MFMTVCIYRYIHATGLYYWPNTTGMTHLKLTGSQPVKKFPEGSLPHLQVPTICPYPEPD